jgi:serine protease Do
MRKPAYFYVLLVAVASMAIGMVLASRLDLTPRSTATLLVEAPPMNSAPITGPIDAHTFREIARSQSPMVVNIRTKSVEPEENVSRNELLPFFEERRPPGRGRRERTAGAGTGFVIDASGFILTNNHVVEDAESIDVGFFDSAIDDFYPARVVGRDPLTDSALIQLTRLPKTALTVARFGDSDRMQPGDWVVAIGNPFNLGHSISVGVVSARGRELQVDDNDGRRVNMLQTDAAINQGNSGGPMLNVRGEVVGINTAILTDHSQNLGIGFAVPINLVRELIPQLRQGKVVRGVIGVRIAPMPSHDYEVFGVTKHTGVVVSSVERDSPASRAGLRRGDIITHFDGREVPNDVALVEMVTRTSPGKTVPIAVLRNRERQTLHVTVDELKQDDAPLNSQATTPTDGSGFGITLSDLTADLARRLETPRGLRGAVVADVEAESSADEGRLDEGDIIVEVNGETVSDATDGRKRLQAVPVGRLARIVVFRDGHEVFLTLRKPS